MAIVDLAHERLQPEVFANAGLVAIHLAMHTATRIAAEALPRIREYAADALVATYGLYAPFNATWLHEQGVTACLGGEFEPALEALVRRVEAGEDIAPFMDLSTGRTQFVVPDRTGMPPLAEHARLRLADGQEITMAFTDATRGCKHLCRHCPVVPVYNGRFRIVPVDVVLADIRQQVAAGAQHVSFGDPDFLNGPTHALRVARAMHAEFADLTFDAVIKVEHLLQLPEQLAELKQCGLRMVISAVESVDDEVLDKLDKGHTRADFIAAVELARKLGIELAPTFLAFTPWTTLEGYRALLCTLVELDLYAQVPPIQLAIRLLIPAASKLLELPDIQALVGPFDARSLGHAWQHPDSRVDALQQRIEAIAASAETRAREDVFAEMWQATHEALQLEALPLAPSLRGLPAHHTENWYCCAEPTSEQLIAF